MAQENKPIQSSKGATIQDKEKAIVQLLLRDQAIVRENSSKPIKKGRILLEFNGEPIIRKNTLTVIKGKTGVHKSRLAQQICSVLISDNATKRSAIGFTVIDDKPTKVIYIDTERNLTEHFPEAIQSILENAGYDKFTKSELLEYFTFIGLNRPQRLEGIRLITKLVRHHNHNDKENHIVVVLDVVSDCIINFNDLEETYLLTDEFARCTNNYNVTFIAVIHENPDAIRSTKARGHLGTEIANKASAIIQISRCVGHPNRFMINIEKSRSSQVPKPIYVTYEDNINCLVICDAPVPKEDKIITQLLDYLTKIDGLEISKADLEKGTGIKRTTLDRKLKEIVDSRLQVEISGNSFLVILGKTGKSAVVKLEQSSSAEEEEED